MKNKSSKGLKVFTLAILATVFLAVSGRAQTIPVTTTESFESGTNIGNWTWGTGS